MAEVREQRQKLSLAGGKKEDVVEAFAPFQIMQMRKVNHDSLCDTPKCACLHYTSARLFCTPHALSGVVLLRVCTVVHLRMRPGWALTVHGMSQTIETSVEQSLDDTARALKIYIHNQIAQATLVLSGNSIGEGAPAAAPPPGGHGGLPDVRTTPTLRGSHVDLGL